MNVSKTILLAAAGLSALFLVSAQSAAGRGHMGSGPGHILETCSVEFECAEYSNGALSNCLILSDNCEVTYPGDKAHIINLTAENELNGGRMSGAFMRAYIIIIYTCLHTI